MAGMEKIDHTLSSVPSLLGRPFSGLEEKKKKKKALWDLEYPLPSIWSPSGPKHEWAHILSSLSLGDLWPKGWALVF